MISAEYLTRLGLTDKEAKVYLALLQLGEATVQEVAETAKIKRPTAYFIISTLCQRGLVASGNRGKKTIYLAAHPRTLQLLLQEKEEELSVLNKDLTTLLPQLEAMYSEGEDRRPVIKYYEGKDGQIAMRKEAAEDPGHNIYSFVSLDDLLQSFPTYHDTHERSRIKGKIFSHVLYTHVDGPRPDNADAKELRESRYLPKELFPFSGSVTITPEGGKVYISIYRQHYIGIVIENKTIADMLYSMWKLAWEAAAAYNKKEGAA